MQKEKNSQRLTAFWVFFAYLVWIFAFRGFLSSTFNLTSDALSYYDHTKFFIENGGQGIYPLWDPYWLNGAPNDFFLRRIGAFNPFYLLILLFKSIGIPYTLSYLWFLALYYWSAMIAFYLLAMRIYHDRMIAYAGYLILLFSALGTRLFDSYMMLVTVPLIWFFYFLTAFSQTPRKHFLLGLSLFSMILLGTYIPFYFLIILGFVILLFSLIYYEQVPRVLKNWAGFINENKLLVFLALTALLFSFIPAVNFFHTSSQGQVALPIRHGDAASGQVLTVPRQTLDWGAVEDLLYSAYFSDLRLYKFAVVYVPFFSVILLVLGLFGRITRRAFFIFLLGAILFCCILPHGLPFYDLFYKHMFFLKYFRNLHFFIWFFLIPLFVLLAMEHWDIFREMILVNSRKKWLLTVFVCIVHLIVTVFVWWRNDAILSTYIMIFLSMTFWSLMVLGYLKGNGWGFALLTLTVIIQPLEVYHYLSLKAIHHEPYDYDFSYKQLKIADENTVRPENVPIPKEALYYISGAYNYVYQNISNYALAKYLQNKFILVDRIQPVDRDKAIPYLEDLFLNNENKAIVFKQQEGDIRLIGDDPDPPQHARRIDSNFTGFKLLDFNADHVLLSLDIPFREFLVYNDSYDPGWRVFINDRKTALYQVNGAFKGTWVPAGRNIIEFSYGRWWQYMMNILPSIFALFLLGGMAWYARSS